MKTFKALHAILSFLEAALEMEDFPSAGFNATALDNKTEYVAGYVHAILEARKKL